MSNSYATSRSQHPERPSIDVLTLSSPTGLAISFAVNAGMVGCSMTHEGEQLLGMRHGLGAYIDDGKTFGIPLLAPWANRLVTTSFDGTQLVTDGTPGVHLDGNGLPIHGLLAGCTDWRVTDTTADESSASLTAVLEFTDSRPEFPAFPFPHSLTIGVTLAGSVVTITTRVEAKSDMAVPIAFGYHPYFAPPGGDRQDWTVSKPFTHQLVLDDRAVPTGEVVRVPVELDVLGDPTNGGHIFDDLFGDVPPGTRSWIEGGRHRITLSYDSGYSYAVLFAPPDQPLVAIEPMTAPTDPFAGHFPIKTATQNEPYEATFSIHVTPSGVPA